MTVGKIVGWANVASALRKPDPPAAPTKPLGLMQQHKRIGLGQGHGVALHG